MRYNRQFHATTTKATELILRLKHADPGRGNSMERGPRHGDASKGKKKSAVVPVLNFVGTTL
jgi:hypothetical protein